MKTLRIFAALTLTAFASGAGAQQLDSPLPTDAHVVRGQLPNGLHYIIRRNKKPDKRAELRLVVNAGSILEDDAQRGIAHFVEHMMFDGTKRFPKKDIVNFVERVGCGSARTSTRIHRSTRLCTCSRSRPTPRAC